jgi:hypothetical protein
MLLDCFASADWNKFRDSTDNIDELATSATSVIRNEDVVPTAASPIKSPG